MFDFEYINLDAEEFVTINQNCHRLQITGTVLLSKWGLI